MQVAAISIKKFRNHLSRYFSHAVYGQQPIRIKKYRETAVLMSQEDYDEYERLQNPHTRLSEQEWNEAVAMIDDIRAQIPQYPLEEVERDIAEALAEVRTQPARLS